MIIPFKLLLPKMENLIECEQKNGLETEKCWERVSKPKLVSCHKGVVIKSAKLGGGNEVVSEILR